MYPTLLTYIDGLFAETSLIPVIRKAMLADLAQYVTQKQANHQVAALHFICTHNSRRSQLSQIWAATAAAYYGLDWVQTYSGGTEATAFHPNAVAALERAGFQIENLGGKNPHYQVAYGPDAVVLECFSKTFDAPENPQRNFAAIMTCSDADENCPVILGTDWRLPLTYDDPKTADGTPEAAARYDERTRQIGREMFFALALVG